MFRVKHALLQEEVIEPAAGGTGGTDPAPAAPATDYKYPDNWKDYLPDDLKSESSLGVIKDVAGLAKSYVHAQKSIGAGKVVLPTKHSTEADWKRFYNEIGVPESEEAYLNDVPKEKQDTEFFKEFRKLAHSSGILPQQSKKLLEWYDQLVTKDVEGAQAKYAEKLQAVEADLKKEWGHAYADKLKQSDAVVKELNEKLGGDKFVKMLEETQLGNDPRFAQAMVMVAEMLGEDKFVGQGSTGAMTPAGIQQKILAYQGDTSGPYYDSSHPSHKSVVEEVQQLYKMMNPS